MLSTRWTILIHGTLSSVRLILLLLFCIRPLTAQRVEPRVGDPARSQNSRNRPIEFDAEGCNDMSGQSLVNLRRRPPMASNSEVPELVYRPAL